MNKETCVKVLDTLEAIQASLMGIYVPGFSFQKRFGICWHVYQNACTDMDFLDSTFLELDLDPDFPIECQLTTTYQDASSLYYSTAGNRYDSETEHGKLRLELLENLTVYFKKQIKVLQEIEETESILG